MLNIIVVEDIATFKDIVVNIGWSEDLENLAKKGEWAEKLLKWMKLTI